MLLSVSQHLVGLTGHAAHQQKLFWFLRVGGFESPYSRHLIPCAQHISLPPSHLWLRALARSAHPLPPAGAGSVEGAAEIFGLNGSIAKVFNCGSVHKCKPFLILQTEGRKFRESSRTYCGAGPSLCKTRPWRTSAQTTRRRSTTSSICACDAATAAALLEAAGDDLQAAIGIL